MDETCEAGDNQILNRDYQGSVSETRDGQACVAFAERDHTYCRGSANYLPWCYYRRSKSHWAYCKCPDNPCDTDNGGCQSGETCLNNAGTAECVTLTENCIPYWGGRYMGNKGDTAYTGQVSVTNTGDTCKKWNESKSKKNIGKTGYETLLNGDHNYCRNTPGYAPWCWTTTGSWGYCKCSEMETNGQQTDFITVVSDFAAVRISFS